MFQLYFLLFLILFLSFLVILTKNPVISVLFLIMVFFFSVIIFISLGAEFLSLLILIVYVGAISILFLFVIMLLNLRIVELVDIFLNYLPIGSVIGIIFFLEIFYFLWINFSMFDFVDFKLIYDYINFLYFQNNLILVGEILFNYNGHLVIFAGLVLFVSMIGSIVLTFEDKFLINDDNDILVLLPKKYINFWNKL